MAQIGICASCCLYGVKLISYFASWLNFAKMICHQEENTIFDKVQLKVYLALQFVCFVRIHISLILYTLGFIYCLWAFTYDCTPWNILFLRRSCESNLYCQISEKVLVVHWPFSLNCEHRQLSHTKLIHLKTRYFSHISISKNGLLSPWKPLQSSGVVKLFFCTVTTMRRTWCSLLYWSIY